MIHTQDIIRLIRRGDRVSAINMIYDQFDGDIEDAKRIVFDIEKSQGIYLYCPSCNSKHVFFLHGESISICLECNAIFGEIRLQDTPDFVDVLEMSDGSMEGSRYFDFKIINEGRRLHGWYDVKTKKVTQWG